MKVAVVTPYYDEPSECLARARVSVSNQSHPAAHILVADGRPHTELLGAEGHITLPNHGDYGGTPRAIGAISAFARGYDAVAFLDADCWYEPDHIAGCVRAMEKHRSQFVSASRFLRRPDGALLGTDRLDSDGESHCDTSCMFMDRSSIPILHEWFSSPQLTSMNDRCFWRAVKRQRLKRVHLPIPTVNYTTLWAAHYLSCGQSPPPGAKIFVVDDAGKPSIRPYIAPGI